MGKRTEETDEREITTMKISSGLRWLLKIEAAKRRITMQELVKQAVGEYVERHPSKGGA